MEFFILLTATAIVFTTLFWAAVRHYVIPSTLDNVPGPPRLSFFTGNLSQLYSLYDFEWHRAIFQKYGGVVKLSGMFGAPVLYVSDPKALHAIVVKDQYVFEETSSFIIANKLMFGDGLLATLGEHHRKQRKLLNPVFSISHMRDIIPIFYPITHQLRSVIKSKVKDRKTDMDMLYWISRVALEFIGQAGIGYSFDNITPEEPTNRYTVAVKQLLPALMHTQLSRLFLPLAVQLIPSGSIRRRLGRSLPMPNVRRVMDLIDEMSSVAEEVYHKKKVMLARGGEKLSALDSEVGHGNDIMSVLIRANASASLEDRLPDSEVLGQINTFLFTGSDTTSYALARILWVLSTHPEAQSKLRGEVTEARQSHGDLMYDELTNLPYLDAVCRETLRLYAPVPFMERTARNDAIIPLSKPVTSRTGETLGEIAVEKGTRVVVAIRIPNVDESIWGPDAAEWRPERWLEPLPESVGVSHLPGVYSNMMTFLGGGRACIGFKFSQLEMKVVLSVLLESFVFEPTGEEIVWTIPGISTPAVRGSEHKTPHLPLKVSLVPAV